MTDFNPFIEQVRHRISTRERNFSDAITSIKSSQAAKGQLKSGATIKLCLAQMNSDFVDLIEEVLSYLGKSVTRFGWSLGEPLSICEGLLMESASIFKERVRPNWFRDLASKGVEAALEEANRELDTDLRLRLSDFKMGLHESSPPEASIPPSIPASDRYVSLADNERSEVTEALAEIREEVRGDNEVAEEDRLVALSEIAAFEETIIQPRVSSELIDRFVTTVAKRIASLFSGAMLKVVLTRLVDVLLKLLASHP